MNALISSAIADENGMPRLKTGTICAYIAALFADSGAATPSSIPSPNFSGVLLNFFAILYEPNVANMEPGPGISPTRNPNKPPRPMVETTRFSSDPLG